MSTSTISKKFIAPKVGHIIITDTNTNPSSTYGGTWELIDKAYKFQQLTNTALFTKGVGTSSFGNFFVSLNDRRLDIRISITPGETISTTDVTLGTLDLPNIGIQSEQANNTYYLAENDGANGIAMIELRSTGTILAKSCITKTSGGSMSATGTLQINMQLPVTLGQMVDSFCDKFYWKRTD